MGLLAQSPLSPLEVRIVEEFRTLQQRSQEFKLEIMVSVAHGKTLVSLRPTPYLRLETKTSLSLAVDD